MPAPDLIHQLVQRFDENHAAYRSGEYNEAQLRLEFLNPMFEALGWDVTNKQGYAEPYKEVIVEKSIRVGDDRRAPDYTFRVGKAPVFYVEAKKPSVNLKDDISPAFQLRRYAWSTKLPLSILSDFEEFAVYDCRIKPDKHDKATTGRLTYLEYPQLPEKWDEIAAIFSRPAVLKGSFEQYAESVKGKHGTLEVDDAFLAEIERWRDLLARNIALRNPALSQRELNYAVQMTIDRLIFLRICEDRGIERYGQLKDLLKAEVVYPDLCRLFRQADARFNSGLFHFDVVGAGLARKDTHTTSTLTRPHNDEPPDGLTLGLSIDDKPLKDILKNVYYPDSPYAFSVLPADILGQVYERFLGKVIRLTEGHRAVVEDKPEVKKAGGVFYTPTFIVEYIVKHTLGALLQGKKPGEVGVGGGIPLRILDMACGSGSFLLGAFQYLLDWYLSGYITDGPAKWAKGRSPALVQISTPLPTQPESAAGEAGEWKLTIAERKRILLDHIYGVDIDPQAVEVTKLSLLLWVLEGESEQTIGQLSLFQERVLPDLGKNIKCGNSLIGPDFYQGRQASFLDDEQCYRINAFDWQAEFGEVFIQTGGFDVVIGNPPWLMAGYYLDIDLEYIRKKYKTAQGKFDLYYTFIEKGHQLLSETGLFGMIVPNKFFHTKAASNLRALLSQKRSIRTIVDFGDEQIFAGATNYSCIVLMHKQSGPNPIYHKAKGNLTILEEFDIPWNILSSEPWHFGMQDVRSLFGKLETIGQPLQWITARFGTGVQSGADRILMVQSADAIDLGLETETLKPILRGRDIRRYAVSSEPKFLIFPYKVQNSEFVIFSEAELQEFKNTYTRLLENKQKLNQRIWFGKGAQELSGKWFGMMYLDAYSSFSHPHILTPCLSNRSNFSLGTEELFATGTAGVTSVIPKSDISENILYLLGLLNSTLISHYVVHHSPVFSGGYYKFSGPYLRKIPIRRINLSNPADIEHHNQMVALVERMLALRQQLAAAKTPTEKTHLQRQIEATDHEIDRLVYALYELTPDEIAIVEGKGKI